MKKLKVLELFSGIRAFSQALENLGIDYECVDSVEIDKYAVKSQNAIYGTNFEPQDITTWDKDLEVDLIMHGSPCQDFSIAGKGKGGDEGSGTRSSLLYETVRIVERLQPKYVIWENVKAVLNKNHKHNFDKYLEKMEELGYTNYYQVLNAKDYGIPQNRERVFTVSILGNGEFDFPNIIKNNNKIITSMIMPEQERPKGNYLPRERVLDTNGISRAVTTSESQMPWIKEEFTFPPKQELKLRLKDMLENEVDEKYYLNGQNMKTYMREFGSKGKIYNNDTKTISTMTSSMGTGGENCPAIKIKNATKKGYIEATDGDGIDLAYPDSETRRGRVQEQKSNTITTSDNLGVIENYRIRKLTPLECWRLMGFSDEAFYKAQAVNSNSQLYKQAGNSIVVNVLEAILRQLFDIS